MLIHNFKLTSVVLDFGYKSKLLTLAKNCGFVVLIYTSPIPVKKMADTTDGGPPFVFILRAAPTPAACSPCPIQGRRFSCRRYIFPYTHCIPCRNLGRPRTAPAFPLPKGPEPRCNRIAGSRFLCCTVFLPYKTSILL